MRKANKIILLALVGMFIGLIIITIAQMRSSSPAEHIEQSHTINTVDDLAQVTKMDNKVNVYFFWGKGCPHCAEEFEFFKNIEAGYGDKYNLYTFETWYNSDNSELMKIFAAEMGDELRGVPYTVIGAESFIGFPTDGPRLFIEAIENQSQKDFDVYLDKIK